MTRQTTHYAHSLPGRPVEEWHGLEEHLKATAKLAGTFATSFDSGDWAYLAGLWHDLGKYQPEFQRRLRGDKIAVEHSGAGAAHAVAKHGSGTLPLAFVIAGHHAGLANLIRSEPDSPTPLKERLATNAQPCRQLTSIAPEAILDQLLPPLPLFLKPGLNQEEHKLRIEFWIRFLFSALTDADYLDTEQALDPDRASIRPQEFDCGTLLPLIEAAITQKAATAPKSSLQEARSTVVTACRDAAALPPGLFSLTAPTGSGKTLASMLFAVRHAISNGLHRVIVVLPYTSIIEQNAKVFREAFGDDLVVEHHSNLDPQKESERKGEELTAKHALASENWDAPIIVTTTVQFFESLFANRTSRCRKLHNIARSVVILDEVQSLPPDFLVTILDALKQLAAHYGCTIILSTATPPALVARPGFPIGLPHVTEIIPDPAELARSLRRVTYRWPDTAVPETWDSLADRMAEHRCALAVVHLRNDARVVAENLAALRPDELVYHLSAAMCAKHRSNVLDRVRAGLAKGQTCRLVSTQLIEAGVDIDFPVLFRAMAGLDSIVQAAGRCNREGNPTPGTVHIFQAPTEPPPGVLRRGLETMRALLAAKGTSLDPSDPGVCEEYFRAFYSITARDTQGIQAERSEFNFATVASKFRLIDDLCTASIVVHYADSEERLRRLERQGRPTREGLRGLQPFTVHIYPQAFARLNTVGAISEVFPGGGLFQLLPPFYHLYDKQYGLILGADIVPDAARLII
jgi:CRISPR-associated endonuclease/helicase Cas3